MKHEAAREDQERRKMEHDGKGMSIGYRGKIHTWRPDDLTEFTEPSPSWAANTCSASTEIPSLLWHPKVHCNFRTSPPLSSFLSMPHLISLRSILILFSDLRLGLPSGFLPRVFLPKRLCIPILSHVRYMIFPPHSKTKLRGFSPQANYTDRAAAACRWSWCQLLRIQGVARNGSPRALISIF
jgi:hypothetical protein